MPRQAEVLRKRVNTLRKEMNLGSAADVSVMMENFTAMADAIIKMEDEGWAPINSILDDQNRKGLSIGDLQKIVKYTEKHTKSNNLLGRGLRLKNNYVLGRGFKFARLDGKTIAPRFQKIIDDPENQDVLFSEDAAKELNRILFTAGNLLVIYNTKTAKFTRLTVDPQLTNYLAYDDDPGRVKYWRRAIQVRNDLRPGALPQEIIDWIPVWQYKNGLPKGSMPKTLPVGGDMREPVNQDCVIIDLRVNKDDGEILGIPDCLSALPWAWAANEYLKDASKLAKAIATIAYQVKAKTLAAAERAGAKLQSGKVGSAAITGPDTEISQLPRAGGIDMYEGRPLQAAVANALDVSVAALTADTAKGGSYASETALSQPEQLAAISRQTDFRTFFHKVFLAMGAEGVEIDFARVDVDPIHRRLQSLGIARTLGGINQQEFRDASIELLDIKPTETALPEPDEFTGSKYSTLPEVIDAGIDLAKDQAKNDAIASQGNSGAVGSLDDNGNDARQSDKSGSTA